MRFILRHEPDPFMETSTFLFLTKKNEQGQTIILEEFEFHHMADSDIDELEYMVERLNERIIPECAER